MVRLQKIPVTGKREKMADFLYQYLKQQFGLEQMVVEWAYNLREGLQRFAKDDRVAIFNAVLTEQVRMLEISIENIILKYKL